jgi:hypothetical protein
LHLSGEVTSPHARCAGQNDPRPLHLEEGQDLAVRDLAKDRFITRPESQWVRRSTTHGRRTQEGR